jgi:hypothetical protein
MFLESGWHSHETHMLSMYVYMCVHKYTEPKGNIHKITKFTAYITFPVSTVHKYGGVVTECHWNDDTNFLKSVIPSIQCQPVYPSNATN